MHLACAVFAMWTNLSRTISIPHAAHNSHPGQNLHILHSVPLTYVANNLVRPMLVLLFASVGNTASEIIDREGRLDRVDLSFSGVVGNRAPITVFDSAFAFIESCRFESCGGSAAGGNNAKWCSASSCYSNGTLDIKPVREDEEE
jgi:hypothetical protein